jgi:diguanylate cyclase (GGDEF)-like protein/PAS domain S-box-containing protein
MSTAKEIELLRQRAEAALVRGARPAWTLDQPKDMKDAIHLVEELCIYQTELEIQNHDMEVAQQRIESALHKYRQLFEFLPMESLLVDTQGFIVEANGVARQRFGLRQPASLQRRSVYQLFDMPSRTSLHVALEHDEEHTQAVQCRLAEDSAGARQFVDAHFIKLDTEASTLATKMVVLVDRTSERQLAAKHEEVSRSEARYRALFDESKVPMLLIEPKSGEIVRGNLAALKFYGYNDAQLSSKRITDINCLSAAQTAVEMALAAREQREHFFFEHRLADGREIPVEVHSGPIEIDGRPLLYSVVHDISERVDAQKRADEAHTAERKAAVKLAEFNRDFEAFLDQTTDFVYFKNQESRFRFCSQTLAQITGFANWRDMVGKHDREVFPADTAAIYEAEERPLFTHGTPLLNKVDPFYNEKGQPGFVQTSKWPLFDSLGKVSGIFGISRDVTEAKRKEARLELSANVFSNAREGILVTDAQANIVAVNEAFTRITGYVAEDVLGKNPRILQSGLHDPAFYKALWKSVDGKGFWEGEMWDRRKNGEEYPQLTSISRVFDSQMQVINYVALITDISPQKDHERALEYMARYDRLTGLPNRTLLADRLQQGMSQCLRSKHILGVVFVDLDGFKAVNDAHGHDTGDQLLVALAQRMKGALREGDTLARIGGDEFVAVLMDLDQPHDCEIVLSRILLAASEAVNLDGISVRVSASVGVTLYPQDAVNADQLLRHADHAMYQAKQAGKNRYHYFDVKDDTAVKLHRDAVDELHHALINNELLLYYQPKVNMKTGAVVGYEALLRWQHPQKGLLLPGSFLPTIKNHHLSVEIGQWVIAHALQQLADWNHAGLRTKVSVNIDAHHLQQADFAASLAVALAKQPQVKSEQLDLEVLETSALDDIDKVTATMSECCNLGLGFSLDDFGTGYSSLTYLKRLPADLIKIDQSFVIGMVADAEYFVIVEGVVGLAKAFGRPVIAEGVETVVHGELLLALGCNLGQGYGIAKPMPASEVALWQAQWRPAGQWSIWNDPAHIENNRDLVVVEIKHRHWLRDIENYVRGKADAAPALDASACPFGVWLKDRGHARYAHQPQFAAVISAHDQVHTKADFVVSLFESSKYETISQELTELNLLRDALIQAVRELT